MLNPRRDSHLLSLGAATSGAASLDDCREAGLSARRLCDLVATGRWQSPYPRVFVTFSGPIPRATLLWAAIIYAGADATLSHVTAGQLLRLARESPVIHVTVPYARDADDQPGLRVHRSRTLRPEDSHPVFAPRRTTMERTVLDLLASQPTATAALALVASALRSRGTTADRLRLSLAERPRTRWRKVVAAALPDLHAGAQSVLELRDAELRRRHGLPAGSRQVKRVGEGAEYLDVLIEEFRLHVETDGRLGHDRAQEIWRDMRRDNRSEVLGYRHLRYGWADLVDRGCQVALEQAEVLRQQGWQGRFRRCPHCPPGL
jgi:very-short-patch-repair endonuclease